MRVCVCGLNAHFTAWRVRCASKACIAASFPDNTIAATVREGGQIDVRADPLRVGRLVSLFSFSHG